MLAWRMRGLSEGSMSYFLSILLCVQTRHRPCRSRQARPAHSAQEPLCPSVHRLQGPRVRFLPVLKDPAQMSSLSLSRCQRTWLPVFNETVREDQPLHLFFWLRRARGICKCDTYTQTDSRTRELKYVCVCVRVECVYM